jgi:hypothetical protein
VVLCRGARAEGAEHRENRDGCRQAPHGRTRYRPIIPCIMWLSTWQW